MSPEFFVVVLVVVATPGADFVVTLRKTVARGRRAGTATAVGVGAASAIQGTLVPLGLGTLIVQSQLLFTALKWLGIAYLAYLAFLAFAALRSAWSGKYDETHDSGSAEGARRGLQQGFLTNITNPKMFVFYLSLLPQFLGSAAPVWQWLAHAWVLPLMGTTWLVVTVVLAGVARERLLKPLARRIMDGASGLALLGFGARLATQAD